MSRIFMEFILWFGKNDVICFVCFPGGGLYVVI